MIVNMDSRIRITFIYKTPLKTFIQDRESNERNYDAIFLRSIFYVLNFMLLRPITIKY